MADIFKPYSLSIKHDVYWKSIILSAKMKGWDDKDVEKLGKVLRKFYYLYWLADYTTSKTKQTSFNMIEWVPIHLNIVGTHRLIWKKTKNSIGTAARMLFACSIISLPLHGSNCHRFAGLGG